MSCSPNTILGKQCEVEVNIKPQFTEKVDKKRKRRNGFARALDVILPLIRFDELNSEWQSFILGDPSDFHKYKNTFTKLKMSRQYILHPSK